MAEWKYRIERIELKPDAEPDAQLEEILQGYPRRRSPRSPITAYRVIPCGSAMRRLSRPSRRRHRR